MPTLMDELRADQGKPTQCTVCIWLGTRPKDEQDEWGGAMKSHRSIISHASIHRAIVRRVEASEYDGPAIGRSSVERHRNDGHIV